VHVIADWVDAGSVTLPGKNVYRQEAGISPEAFVVVYGGNIGMAAGVETVLDAMRLVQIDREVVLVIAGSGSQLAACQKKAEDLTQIRTLFHSPWAREDTSKVLASADILVLPTRGRQSLVSVPSKLIAYMLSERPVLAAVLDLSETAQIIHSARCGWIVPPDDSRAMAEAVQAAMQLPAEKKLQMGSSGRTYALTHFTTEKCLPEVLQIIYRAASDS
jgi:glycosyltransferase involved in cell wall biosynthesis